MNRTRIIKITAGVAGAALAFVAFVGVAHTPWGRPMLGWLTGAPGCPIGAELDDASLAAVRSQVTASLPGDAPAKTRAVFDGLTLGQSSSEHATNWARERSLTCTTKRKRALSCVGPFLGSDRAALTLRFDEADTLQDIEASVHAEHARDAVALADQLNTRIEADAGEPTASRGKTGHAYLAAAPLRQSRHEYSYADVHAEVTATNLGPRGFVVRGIVQAVGDTP